MSQPLAQSITQTINHNRAPKIRNPPLIDANDPYQHIAASHYSIERLAELYNATRVDYIVPMPMNVKRMNDYIHQYDVHLDASAVVVETNAITGAQELGIVMIGLRDHRAWVTRLGVLPEHRRKKLGQYLMELIIERSQQYGATQLQLEVIVGNDPAYRLFVKLGFEPYRELLIIRRPPSVPQRADILPILSTQELAAEQIQHYLLDRDQQLAVMPSWTEEALSLLNSDQLKGFEVTFADGTKNWLIYQLAPFQITHVAIDPTATAETSLALLYTLHTQHPLHDAKVENLPADSPYWASYQHLGYLEEFRRIEMYRALS